LDGDVAEAVGRKVYARARGGVPRPERAELSPDVAEKLALAREAERRLFRAIHESPVPSVDVEVEVGRLMQELENLARQADRVTAYLADEDEAAVRARLDRLRRTQNGDPQIDRANAQAAAALQDQLDASHELSRQLAHFDAQMEHIAATLGAINAQIVRMSVVEEASAQVRIAEQVRDLRREVDAAADALHDAYRELD
jgi:chromosome segregation ATPase